MQKYRKSIEITTIDRIIFIRLCRLSKQFITIYHILQFILSLQVSSNQKNVVFYENHLSFFLSPIPHTPTLFFITDLSVWRVFTGKGLSLKPKTASVECLFEPAKDLTKSDNFKIVTVLRSQEKEENLCSAKAKELKTNRRGQLVRVHQASSDFHSMESLPFPVDLGSRISQDNHCDIPSINQSCIRIINTKRAFFALDMLV